MTTFDWDDIDDQLARHGHARVGNVLAPDTCRSLIGLYGDDSAFRSRIDMARYNFGQGDYAYFAYPLPAAVQALRTALYAGLAPIANRLATAAGDAVRYPDGHAGFLDRCHTAGQPKPTPLILRYEAGGYNRLHRDLYGDTAFPLQAAIALNRRGDDYDGGEFVLVENIPRQQSRARVVALAPGEMVIFPVNTWRTRGARGWIRTSMRHGVSPVTRGERWVLGIILHDAA